MRFEHPFAAAVSLVVFLVLYVLWNRRRGGRYFGYSDASFFPSPMPFTQRLIVYLPMILFVSISLIFFLALARPIMKDLNKVERVLARDIVMVVDMSYSMQMALPVYDRYTVYKNPQEVKRKIDAAKEVAVEFVGKRKTDRFGVMIFGDDTFGLWPMTTDHQVISAKISMLNADSGYGFLGGTDLLKAVDAGITYIEKDSDAKEPILVFISDGEGSSSDEDLNELIYRLRERNIHFYWILMEKDAAMTGSPIETIVSSLKFGKKFSAVNDAQIKQALAEIDSVEKTRTVLTASGDDYEIYPQLCLLAALMVIGAVFMEGYRL